MLGKRKITRTTATPKRGNTISTPDGKKFPRLSKPRARTVVTVKQGRKTTTTYHCPSCNQTMNFTDNFCPSGHYLG